MYAKISTWRCSRRPHLHRRALASILAEIGEPYRDLDEGDHADRHRGADPRPGRHRLGLVVLVDEADTLPTRLIEDCGC